MGRSDAEGLMKDSGSGSIRLAQTRRRGLFRTCVEGLCSTRRRNTPTVDPYHCQITSSLDSADIGIIREFLSNRRTQNAEQ
jgi:hypothetical protein